MSPELHRFGLFQRARAEARDELTSVRVTLLVHVCLLVLGSFAMPLLMVPDERFHADMVMVVGEGMGWPQAGEREIGPEMEVAGRLLRHTPRTTTNVIPARPSGVAQMPPCEGRPLPECVHRPTMEELGAMGITSGTPNRASQHPPLYYVVVSAVGNTVASLLPAGTPLPFDTQLWMYRLVSVLLVAPLPLIAARTSRVLGAPHVVQVSAALAVLAVPGFYFRSASMINNDSLVVLLSSLLVLMLVTAVRRGWNPRRAIGVGLVTGLALLTKGLALPLVGAVAVAGVLTVWRERAALARTATWVAAALGLSFVIGGWWWIRNVLLYGRVQPLVFEPPDPQAQSFASAGSWLVDWSSTLFASFWGQWFVSRGGLLFAVLAALVLLGVIAGLARRDGLQESLVPAVLVPLLLAGVAFVSLRRFLESGLLKGAQGRYLYPALTGTAALWAIGTGMLLRRTRRWLPLLVLTAAVILQARSLPLLLRRGWGAAGASFAEQWRTMLAWSPVGAAPVVVVVLVLTTGVALLAVLLVRSAAGPPFHEGSVGSGTVRPGVHERKAAS